jgi:hypothetical protein
LRLGSGNDASRSVGQVCVELPDDDEVSDELHDDDEVSDELPDGDELPRDDGVSARSSMRLTLKKIAFLSLANIHRDIFTYVTKNLSMNLPSRGPASHINRRNSSVFVM